jgi:hypothetical protein
MIVTVSCCLVFCPSWFSLIATKEAMTAWEAQLLEARKYLSPQWHKTVDCWKPWRIFFAAGHGCARSLASRMSSGNRILYFILTHSQYGRLFPTGNTRRKPTLLFLRAVSDRVHGFHCLLVLVRSLARANMYAHGWYLRYRESLTAKTNTHQWIVLDK